MKKYVLCALFACAADSAFAETTVSTQYYVVRDQATKKCAIVDERPGTKTTTVDDEIFFRTRTEAETGMQAMKACTAVPADYHR
jgi:hypothetical protein